MHYGPVFVALFFFIFVFDGLWIVSQTKRVAELEANVQVLSFANKNLRADLDRRLDESTQLQLRNEALKNESAALMLQTNALKKESAALLQRSPTPANKTHVELVFAILTGTHYHERRDLLRRTWLKIAKQMPNVAAFFIVPGIDPNHPNETANLEEEARFHGDMVIDYRLSNAYSTILLNVKSAAEYAVAHYTFDYFVKTDDDTWNSPDVWLNELRPHKGKTFHLGKFEYNHPPVTDKKGKWYYKEWFNLKICTTMYPPFTFGVGYAFSYDVTQFVAQPFIPFYFMSGEDVGMGLWLLATQIERIHSSRIANTFHCGKQFMAMHYALNHMETLYNNVVNNKSICSDVKK